MTTNNPFSLTMKHEEFLDVDEFIQKTSYEYIFPFEEVPFNPYYEISNLFKIVNVNFINRGCIKYKFSNFDKINHDNLSKIAFNFNLENKTSKLQILKQTSFFKYILCVISNVETNQLEYLFCICSITIKKKQEIKKNLYLIELPVSDYDEQHKYPDFLDLSSCVKKSFYYNFDKVFLNASKEDIIIEYLKDSKNI